MRFPARETTGYAWIVGLRNSHDKSYPAGLVAGSRVLVCDNLAFTGEVQLSRKHTRHAVRDLKHLTARAMGQLGDRFRRLDERIATYQCEPMPERPPQSTLRSRIDGAIESLANEPPGMLAKAFGIASSNLAASRFAIKKLSSSLPQYQPEDPDIAMLYELCDQLVEKRLNPKTGRSASVREFLDEG